jgi:LuxR family maltose regulon positive regulatory protein
MVHQPGGNFSMLLETTHHNRSHRSLTVEALTQREIEILRWVATGQLNQEIADELGIALGTVKWHLSNIYGKLCVRNRIQAVMYARRLKLLN